MFTMRPWMAAAALTAALAGAAWPQTPIPPGPGNFAQMAAQSDEYEILAARIALVEAVDPGVRAFAQTMVDDHMRSRQAMRQAATASGLQPPPSAMSSDQAQLLGALQSVRGNDFDRTYVRQQVLAHHQALAVQQSYATDGSDPNLRLAARSIVPTIQHHLEMAQQLRTALGGS